MTCVNCSFQISGRAGSMIVVFLDRQFARPDPGKRGRIMKKLFVASALAFAAVAGAATALQGEDAPPPWAYGFTTAVPPGTPPAPPNPEPVTAHATLPSLTRART